MGFFQTLTAEQQAKVAISEAAESAKVGLKALKESGKWSSKFGELEAMMESADEASRSKANATVRVMNNLQEAMKKAEALYEGSISSMLGPAAMLTPRVIDIVG